MHRVSGAGAGYPVAHVDIDDAISNRNHNSGAAVAHRLRLVKAGADGLQSRSHPIPPHFGHYIADQIRTSLRLRKQTLAGKFGGGALRAGRYQRRCDSHQHTARQQLRSRNFGNLQLTCPRVL